MIKSLLLIVLISLAASTAALGSGVNRGEGFKSLVLYIDKDIGDAIQIPKKSGYIFHSVSREDILYVQSASDSLIVTPKKFSKGMILLQVFYADSVENYNISLLRKRKVEANSSKRYQRNETGFNYFVSFRQKYNYLSPAHDQSDISFGLQNGVNSKVKYEANYLASDFVDYKESVNSKTESYRLLVGYDKDTIEYSIWNPKDGSSDVSVTGYAGGQLDRMAEYKREGESYKFKLTSGLIGEDTQAESDLLSVYGEYNDWLYKGFSFRTFLNYNKRLNKLSPLVGAGSRTSAKGHNYWVAGSLDKDHPGYNIDYRYIFDLGDNFGLEQVETRHDNYQKGVFSNTTLIESIGESQESYYGSLLFRKNNINTGRGSFYINPQFQKNIRGSSDVDRQSYLIGLNNSALRSRLELFDVNSSSRTSGARKGTGWNKRIDYKVADRLILISSLGQTKVGNQSSQDYGVGMTVNTPVSIQANWNRSTAFEDLNTQVRSQDILSIQALGRIGKSLSIDAEYNRIFDESQSLTFRADWRKNNISMNLGAFYLRPDHSERNYGINLGITFRGSSDVKAFDMFRDGRLYGVIFNDLNGNGIKDANEGFLPQIRVTLVDVDNRSLLKEAITTERGEFVFDLENARRYKIEVDYTSMTGSFNPTAFDPQNIYIGDDQNNQYVNIGFSPADRRRLILENSYDGSVMDGVELDIKCQDHESIRMISRTNGEVVYLPKDKDCRFKLSENNLNISSGYEDLKTLEDTAEKVILSGYFARFLQGEFPSGVSSLRVNGELIPLIDGYFNYEIKPGVETLDIEAKGRCSYKNSLRVDTKKYDSTYLEIPCLKK